jgi:hypothetical protein
LVPVFATGLADAFTAVLATTFLAGATLVALATGVFFAGAAALLLLAAVLVAGFTASFLDLIAMSPFSF